MHRIILSPPAITPPAATYHGDVTSISTTGMARRIQHHRTTSIDATIETEHSHF
jgi:hypothetical protein